MRFSAASIVIALVALGCSSGTSDGLCDAAADKVALCTGQVPQDLEVFCADNADNLEFISELPCDMLEGNEGSADGLLGWKAFGESCWLNAECSGELVCRLAYHMEGTRCVERADPATESGMDRACDSDADCVEGLCADGTCEFDGYGDVCTVDEPCSPDHVCTDGVCARPCDSTADCPLLQVCDGSACIPAQF